MTKLIRLGSSYINVWHGFIQNTLSHCTFCTSVICILLTGRNAVPKIFSAN